MSTRQSPILKEFDETSGIKRELTTAFGQS
jgi:hypothetical protein